MTPLAEHPDLAQDVEIEIVPVVEPIVETPVAARAIEVIEMIDAAQVEEAPKKKRSRKKANGTTDGGAEGAQEEVGRGRHGIVPGRRRDAGDRRTGRRAAGDRGASRRLRFKRRRRTTEEAGPDATLLAAAQPPLAPEADLESAADQLFAPSDGIVIEQQIAEGTEGAEAARRCLDAGRRGCLATDDAADRSERAVERPTATFKTTVSPYACRAS